MISSLVLTTLFAFSFATGTNGEVCKILIDKYDRAAMNSRNLLFGSDYRWPNATVPYYISENFTAEDVLKIFYAMDLIEVNSCIKFVDYTDQPNAIYIYTGESGCFAQMGYNSMRDFGIVHLERDSHCMGVGTIQHELLHALGFGHEHARPDRDQYVDIDWSLLTPENAFNWFRSAGEQEDPLPPVCNLDDPDIWPRCYNGIVATTLGLPYDYGSVMHYGLRDGSPDDRPVMTTLQPVPEGTRIGQVKGPSEMDYRKLNVAYSCAPKTPMPTTTTTTAKPCQDNFVYCRYMVFHCDGVKDIRNLCPATCGEC